MPRSERSSGHWCERDSGLRSLLPSHSPALAPAGWPPLFPHCPKPTLKHTSPPSLKAPWPSGQHTCPSPKETFLKGSATSLLSFPTHPELKPWLLPLSTPAPKRSFQSAGSGIPRHPLCEEPLGVAPGLPVQPQTQWPLDRKLPRAAERKCEGRHLWARRPLSLPVTPPQLLYLFQS